MKICQLDWFNKKLNGQKLDKIFGAEWILGKEQRDAESHQPKPEETGKQ